MATLTPVRDVLREMRELKAIVRRQRWISVEDKVPESIDPALQLFNYVLAYDKTYEVNKARFYKGRWISNLGDRLPGVTHWMPMPAKPKEGR